MKDSIDGIKHITLKQAEEFFGKSYDLAEDLESRTPMLNFKGDVIGYIVIHDKEEE